jgi:hypothetical protein
LHQIVLESKKTAVKRTKWNDAMIADHIMQNYRTTGKMPTVTFLKETGQHGLSVQISRTGGFVLWAERLGLSREHSDSDTGWDGERMVCEKIKAMGHVVTRSMDVKSPFDLLVSEVVRVDVKAAKFATYGPCSGWFYRIGKIPQADIIALHQLDTGETYWIPWVIVPRSNITISKDGGKWAAYREASRVLDETVKARIKEFSAYVK